MYLIWGTKTVRKRLGRVAEYCVFCRDVRAFRLVRLSKVSHLYYLPLGRGKPQGCEGTCEGCRTTIAMDEDAYGPPVRSNRRTVEELIDATNPPLLDEWARRQVIEEQAANDELSAHDRVTLLAEPFYLLNRAVELRAATSHLDGRSGAGCLVSIALAVALIVCAGSRSNPAPWIGWSIGIALALSIIYTLLQMHFDVARYVRRVLHPKLCIALAPYAPTPVELELAIARLRGSGCIIGAKLNVDALLRDLYPDAPDLRMPEDAT